MVRIVRDTISCPSIDTIDTIDHNRANEREKKLARAKNGTAALSGEKKRDNIPIRRSMLIDRNFVCAIHNGQVANQPWYSTINVCSAICWFQLIVSLFAVCSLITCSLLILMRNFSSHLFPSFVSFFFFFFGFYYTSCGVTKMLWVLHYFNVFTISNTLRFIWLFAWKCSIESVLMSVKNVFHSIWINQTDKSRFGSELGVWDWWQ